MQKSGFGHKKCLSPSALRRLWELRGTLGSEYAAGSQPFHGPPAPKMSAKPEHKTSPQFQRFPHAHSLSFVILTTAPFPSEKTTTLNHSSEFLSLPSSWFPGFNPISCLFNTVPVSSLYLTPQNNACCWQVLLAGGMQRGVRKSPYLQWRGTRSQRDQKCRRAGQAGFKWPARAWAWPGLGMPARLLALRNERKAPGFLQQPHPTAPSRPGALFSCAETPQTWIRTPKPMSLPSKRTKAREGTLSLREESHLPRACRMFHL